MSIPFRCDQCGNLMQTAEGTAGQFARCPTCGALTQVPEIGQHEGSLDPQPGEALPEVGNPFGAAPTENPYAAPREMIVGAGLLSYSEILIRVRIPAVLLLVVTMAEFGVAGLVLSGYLAHLWQMGWRDADAPFLAYFGGLAVSRVPIMYGCLRMISLRQYRWALAAAWLALVPCSFCWCPEAGVAVWTLVVLHHRQVREAFR